MSTMLVSFSCDLISLIRHSVCLAILSASAASGVTGKSFTRALARARTLLAYSSTFSLSDCAGAAVIISEKNMSAQA